jgi:hypothetical protein
MLKTNRDRVVAISVQGEVSHPGLRRPYSVGWDGVARVAPATGGITYNVRIGDPCLGWAGDHVEPGVSVKNKDEIPNAAFNTFACVGNVATVISGDAKGEKGRVTGKHGGIEHVIVDFAPEVLEKMAIGDKVQVRAYGLGLAITGFPGVKLMSLDPDLLDRMEVCEEQGKLLVPVTHIVPGVVMGSGLGSPEAEKGDYDITTQDKKLIEELGLANLRFGDIVAITDHASFYGRHYRRGTMTIGVVIHSDSYVSGHGPGVTSLMTCNEGEIKPVVNERANLAFHFGIKGDGAKP